MTDTTKTTNAHTSPAIGDIVRPMHGSPVSRYRVAGIIATGPQAGWLKLATDANNPKCKYFIVGHPSVMITIAEPK